MRKKIRSQLKKIKKKIRSKTHKSEAIRSFLVALSTRIVAETEDEEDDKDKEGNI